MAHSLEDIAHELMTDNRPGSDGASNVDRINYISDVLGVERITLGEKYDFSGIMKVKCPDTVNASRHLALLQLDFLKRSFDHYHLEKDEYEKVSASLILEINRLNWHLQHVVEGRPTPPFPFLH